MASISGFTAASLAAGLVGYIGPGPGLGMFWALIALIATVVTAIGAVLLWPLRTLLKKMRDDDGGNESDDEGGDEEAAPSDQLEPGEAIADGGGPSERNRPEREDQKVGGDEDPSDSSDAHDAGDETSGAEPVDSDEDDESDRRDA